MTNAIIVKPAVAKPKEVVEAERVVNDLKSDKPAVALEAAKKVLTEVPFKQPEVKSVTIIIGLPRAKVTFTGDNWCAVDVKFAYSAMKRSFREMQRELYRKEYEKK